MKLMSKFSKHAFKVGIDTHHVFYSPLTCFPELAQSFTNTDALAVWRNDLFARPSGLIVHLFSAPAIDPTTSSISSSEEKMNVNSSKVFAERPEAVGSSTERGIEHQERKPGRAQ